MQLTCPCGALIHDHSDGLPHKAHPIPNQDWLPTWDALDAEVIDRLADGKLTRETAYHWLRQILIRAVRTVWHCRTSGRLLINDRQNQTHCYFPENEQTGRELLRGRDSPV